MIEQADLTPPLAVFHGHPAARRPGTPMAPPYAADPVPSGDKAAWFHGARFAPPGPAQASLSAPPFTVVLAMPRPGLNAVATAPVPADIPETTWEETAVLQRIADVFEPQLPASLDEVESGPFVLPEPVVTVATPAEPEAVVAFWAASTDPAHADDPLAAELPDSPAPPGDAPDGLPTQPAPARDPFWATDPVLDDDLDGPLLRRRRRRLLVPALAGLALLAMLGVAGILLLPQIFVRHGVPAATFNAPMMVLRAANLGRVTSVAVSNGQSVEPSTVLMTLRSDPPPDPAATLLRDRLEAARNRLASLDDALAQSTPNTDAGRARLADLRRQRVTAATDAAQLQDGVANIPPKVATDVPVRAGVHGVVRSLETQNGATIAAGAPLVRMLDCDHAFLTTAPEATLHPGDVVAVRLPNLPPVAATVRRSSGIAEPTDALVIAPAVGAFIGQLSGSCPIGATATVTPGPATS